MRKSNYVHPRLEPAALCRFSICINQFKVHGNRFLAREQEGRDVLSGRLKCGTPRRSQLCAEDHRYPLCWQPAGGTTVSLPWSHASDTLRWTLKHRIKPQGCFGVSAMLYTSPKPALIAWTLFADLVGSPSQSIRPC